MIRRLTGLYLGISRRHKAIQAIQRGRARWVLSLVAALLLVWPAGIVPATVADQSNVWPEIILQKVADGLSRPVHIAHAGDGSGRIFIVEQLGRIQILQNEVILPTPFLDIRSRVKCCHEQGLLSVAFPPGYAGKGHFYVYYVDLAGDLVIARYHTTANPNVADPESEEIVLLVPHPQLTIHNGGQLAFSPRDGYLYAGPGDGGAWGDWFGNAQDPQNLLGKILRIDVETGNPLTYTIPSTNPYTQTTGYRPEIWALGLRNPWRFSFDRHTHDLYIADVGQSEWEEVNFQPASSTGGENYGWNIFEGTSCYDPDSGCEAPDRYVPPIVEYKTSQENCAITGGFVYRGPLLALTGFYLFGDHCSGRIWALRQQGKAWHRHQLAKTPHAISTFGEDESGNLYLADLAEGTVYQILTQPAADRNYFPLVLR